MTNRLLTLLFIGFLLASCTPIGVLVTAGSTAGTMAMEERGFKGATNDYGLKADVIAKWANADISYATGITVIVYNSKALIVGAVESEEQRAELVELTWKVKGIADVFNEITLKADNTLEDFAHDTYIDTRLTAELTFASDIMDINYKFETEGGVVYAIGFAQSKGELNRFITRAKSIPYVRKVVTHVTVRQAKSMYRPNPGPNDQNL